MAAKDAARRKVPHRHADAPVDVAPESGLRKMLTWQEVADALRMSMTTIWRMQERGEFPRAVFLTPGKAMFFEDQIIRWQDEIASRPYVPRRHGGGRRRHNKSADGTDKPRRKKPADVEA